MEGFRFQAGKVRISALRPDSTAVGADVPLSRLGNSMATTWIKPGHQLSLLFKASATTKATNRINENKMMMVQILPK